MLIGVPKEIKDSEDRVGLVPSTVRELTLRGHRVLVQRTPVSGRASPTKPMSRWAARFPATPIACSPRRI
jgi:alanine dehydrogenase